jgi:hypothetical protein
MQKVILPRYERRRSTIVTSNIDWDMWGDYFNDHLGATAMIDRLIHHSHVIVVDGPSARNAEHEREVAAEKARRDAEAKAKADAEAKRAAAAAANAARTGKAGKPRRKPKTS